MIDAQELFRCMCLMQGKFLRPLLCCRVKAIFVWGRAVDEWQGGRFDDGILKTAFDVHQLTGAPIVIPGYTGKDEGQGETGYPGPDVWRPALISLGVDPRSIISTEGHGCNTKTEFEDFLPKAFENNWNETVGVSQPAHVLRAMLGVVKSLEKRKAERTITVIPTYPGSFDWSKECYGSQGQGPLPRLAWIDQEFERVPRYQAQGDLATLAELEAYLRWVHQHM